MPSLVEIDSVVLEKKILNFVNVLLLFRNYLLLENWGPLLAQLLWRRRFLKSVNVFFAISLFSPLGKGCGPSFEQT